MATYWWCAMQKECIVTASDVRFLIQNMGTERCSYFFYIHRKKKTVASHVHYFCLYVHGQCGRVSSLSSLIPIRTADIFILTKEQAFVICKGAKRIAWSETGALII